MNFHLFESYYHSLLLTLRAINLLQLGELKLSIFSSIFKFNMLHNTLSIEANTNKNSNLNQNLFICKNFQIGN